MAAARCDALHREIEPCILDAGHPGPHRSPWGLFGMSADAPSALDQLRELVEADGRTQREIAEAAGMNPAHFSQVITGHRAAPSVVTLAAILGALGKRWADLDG